MIRDELRRFELELNASKTSLKSTSEYNEETWPHKVKLHRISRDARKQTADLISFFSSVIEIAHKNPEESISVYAMKLTTQIIVGKENWDVYEAFLIRTARDHPNSFDLISKIICTYAALGYPISPSVGRLINSTVAGGARLGQHFEVAWALWLAISLEINLSDKAVESLRVVENSTCNILSLFGAERGFFHADFRQSDWAMAISAGSLTEEN